MDTAKFARRVREDSEDSRSGYAAIETAAL